MKRKILGYMLQAPLVLIIILAFFASIYAKIKNLAQIDLIVIFILLAVIILYFIGLKLIIKKDLYDF